MSSNVQNKRTGEQAALYAEYLVEEEKSWAYALCHVRFSNLPKMNDTLHLTRFEVGTSRVSSGTVA